MSFVLPRPPEELMNLVQKANQVPSPAKAALADLDAHEAVGLERPE